MRDLYTTFQQSEHLTSDNGTHAARSVRSVRSVGADIVTDCLKDVDGCTGAVVVPRKERELDINHHGIQKHTGWWSNTEAWERCRAGFVVMQI